jgi:hypothetical protein
MRFHSLNPHSTSRTIDKIEPDCKLSGTPDNGATAPDPHSLCPLSSTECVEPPKSPGYATGLTSLPLRYQTVHHLPIPSLMVRLSESHGQAAVQHNTKACLPTDHGAMWNFRSPSAGLPGTGRGEILGAAPVESGLSFIPVAVTAGCWCGCSNQTPYLVSAWTRWGLHTIWNPNIGLRCWPGNIGPQVLGLLYDWGALLVYSCVRVRVGGTGLGTMGNPLEGCSVFP